MSAATIAVIPIKSLANVKQRLASRLSQRERAELVLRLLEREVAVLRQSAGIDQIVIVTAGERVAALAEMHGALVALHPDNGVNAAVEAGIQRAYEEGAQSVLALHGDLPFVDVADIEMMLSASAPETLAISPDRRGIGTNAIVVQRGMEIRLQFGQDSYRRFVSSAQADGFDVRSVTSEGLGFDLDVPADLLDYRGRLVANAVPRIVHSQGNYSTRTSGERLRAN